MPKIFLHSVCRSTVSDDIIAWLMDENGVYGVNIYISNSGAVEAPGMEIAVFNFGASHRFVNDAVLGAAVVMKLNELTTPETETPLLVNIVEPIEL